MITRKIRPEELKRTNELFAVSFQNAFDNTKSAEEFYRSIDDNPRYRGDYYWRERWATFDDDGCTMMSYFSAQPYTVNFDGHHCVMTGIGGVSTLPQYRRRGGIRACFQAALPDMYNSGVSFSYLYPFSTAYYRKFGYEMCCDRLRYKIKLDMLPAGGPEGSCHLAEPDNLMLDDIKSVYQIWQDKYNMMVVNGDTEYIWAVESNPAKNQNFTFVYKSKDGTAKGYMTFALEWNGEERNLSCSRFFFTDAEGFKGLMSLLRSYASDFQYVMLETPVDIDITLMLPEWSLGAGSCTRRFCGMVRAVNVAKVLQMAKYRGSGKVIIDIRDDFIEENNKRFLIEYSDNAASEVRTTDAPADISMPVSSFSQMITGARSLYALEYMDNIRLSADIDALSGIFYRKPSLITESF